MELAGNVWEQTFTIGGSYRADYHIVASPVFTGTHGNGNLGSTGEFDATGWGAPGDATNSILRGGGFNSSAAYCAVSDRYHHMVVPKPNVTRNPSIGGRGARTN